MIKVGIDACSLLEQMNGIKRSTEELISRLVLSNNEFFLYSSRPIDLEKINRSKVTLRAKKFHNRLGKMIWSQTCLPYYLKKDNIDVFWGPSHRLPHFLPNSIARVVTINDLVWCHAGNTMRTFSKFTEKLLMPDAVNIADRIIAISDSTANDIKKQFPQLADKIRVIHLASSLKECSYNKKYLLDIGIRKSYILFVGTLEPRKNLIRLINAFSKLSEDLKNQYQLVIVGKNGWGNVNIDKYIEENGLIKNVIVLNNINDKILFALYKYAYCVALPSLYEGCGLPIIEAHSLGIPVLTSNISSMPEIAGDAAILVNPLNEGSIVAGLYKLLSDKNIRDNLANKAKKNAQRFNWNIAADKVQNILKEAIDDRKNKFGK